MSANARSEPLRSGTKLIVRVLQDLLAAREYDSLADVAEDLKCRCGRLDIPYDSGLISDAINRVEEGGAQPIVQRHTDAAPAPVLERDPSPADAVDILRRLQAGTGQPMPKAAIETTRQADHRRAAQLVSQAILDSIDTCERLEADATKSHRG